MHSLSKSENGAIWRRSQYQILDTIAVDAGDNDHGNPAGGWENSREMVVADWLVPEGLEGTPEPASLPLFQFQSWHDLHQQNQPTVHHFLSSRIIVPQCASSATSSYCASSDAKSWGKMGADDDYYYYWSPSYDIAFIQTWYLSKNLHSRYFRPKILHHKKRILRHCIAVQSRFSNLDIFV